MDSGATQVALVRAGGDAGLEAFCRSRHARLVGLLGLYCGDRDLAEDLAQEAFARLCPKWPTLPTEADAERWLTRVALNLAKSSFRMGSTRRRLMDRYAPTLLPHPGGEDVSGTLAVRAAVASLPERQRRVVLLRFFADLSVAQTSEVLDIPTGTVKSLTSQAVSNLRRSGLEFDDA